MNLRLCLNAGWGLFFGLVIFGFLGCTIWVQTEYYMVQDSSEYVCTPPLTQQHIHTNGWGVSRGYTRAVRVFDNITVRCVYPPVRESWPLLMESKKSIRGWLTDLTQQPSFFCRCNSDGSFCVTNELPHIWLCWFGLSGGLMFLIWWIYVLCQGGNFLDCVGGCAYVCCGRL